MGGVLMYTQVIVELKYKKDTLFTEKVEMKEGV